MWVLEPNKIWEPAMALDVLMVLKWLPTIHALLAAKDL
jgi:hypothetical protein